MNIKRIMEREGLIVSCIIIVALLLLYGAQYIQFSSLKPIDDAMVSKLIENGAKLSNGHLTIRGEKGYYGYEKKTDGKWHYVSSATEINKPTSFILGITAVIIIAFPIFLVIRFIIWIKKGRSSLGHNGL